MRRVLVATELFVVSLVTVAFCGVAMAVPFTGTAHAAAAPALARVVAQTVVIRPKTNDMTCPAVSPDYCDQPSHGNDAAVRVRIPTRFSSIVSACFTFHFSGDLLDPGEFFLFNVGGGGFGYDLSPDSPVSLDVRTLCLGPPDLHPQVLSLYDGHQAFDVWMFRGTANLSAVELSIIGTPI